MQPDDKYNTFVECPNFFKAFNFLEEPILNNLKKDYEVPALS